jgi:hypothetical protein
VDQLTDKVNILSDVVQKLLDRMEPAAPASDSEYEEYSGTTSPLIRESVVEEGFTLGDVATELAVPAVAKANPSRVQRGEKLQHFGTPDWESVRFSEVQKSYVAKPLFSALETNDELKRIPRVDTLVPQENFCAALTHGLIIQREAVKESLNGILEWATSAKVTHSALSAKIAEEFSPKSDFEKVSRDLLQMVCGKRAGIVSQRREALLSAVKDRYTQSTFKKIPPSTEFLFDSTKLSEAIQRMGGIDKCVPSGPRISVGTEPGCSGNQGPSTALKPKAIKRAFPSKEFGNQGGTQAPFREGYQTSRKRDKKSKKPYAYQGSKRTTFKR